MMRFIRRIDWRILIVFVAVLLLFGCTGGGGSKPSSTPGTDHPWKPTSSAPQPTAGQDNPDPLLARYGPAPLDAFTPSKADKDASIASSNLLITQCMKKRGFTFTPTTEGDDATPQFIPWQQFLGLTDMNRAKTRGYQVDDLTAARAKESQMEQTVAPRPTTSAAYREALWGKSFSDPSSSDLGCDGEATAKMTSPKNGVDVNIQGELAVQAADKTAADPQVRKTLKAWSECMAGHGYQIATPPMPNSTADVTQSDIEKAVTDINCKQSSTLTDTYITTLYRNEKDLIAAHQSTLDAYVQWGKQNAKLAQQILAKG